MSRARARRLAGLAVLACVAVACRKSPPKREGTGSELVVASPHHDFGRVTQGDTLRHAFVAHNRTSAVLDVEDTDEVLGCRATAVPALLPPGANGKLEVTCRAAVPGPLRVSLPLRANGRPTGELSVAAVVEPLLVFDRDLLELSMPFGEERRAEVRLGGKRAKEAQLAEVAPPPSMLEANVIPGDGEKSGGVAIRARGSAVGMHAGSLRYTTGLAEPREVSLPYAVKVTGTLAVSPTNPVLELGKPGPKRTVVKVTSTQPGFSVSRAEVLEGPFTARVQRAGDGYEVHVTAIETKLSATERGVNGRLRIVSNDRTEGAKEIPVLGIGQAPVTRRGLRSVGGSP